MQNMILKALSIRQSSVIQANQSVEDQSLVFNVSVSLILLSADVSGPFVSSISSDEEANARGEQFVQCQLV